MSIGYEIQDRVAFISFCRPEKRNAIRIEELIDLRRAFERFDLDDDADVGILHGLGPSFCSGADVSELRNALSQQRMSERVALALEAQQALLLCENYKPVIAAIHGFCLGHGVVTAFLCDLVVAARGTTMQTETRLGVPVPGFWQAMGGSAFGLEVTLTGRTYSAEEAYQAGVIARLTDEGDHLQAAREMAAEMLACPQDALREIVRVRRAVVAEQMTHLRAITGSVFMNWAHRGSGAERIGQVAARLE